MALKLNASPFLGLGKAVGAWVGTRGQAREALAFSPITREKVSTKAIGNAIQDRRSAVRSTFKAAPRSERE